MRNLIAVFFMLVFSMQALPFKMVGKAFGKNMQTEEVQDDDCNDTDDDGKDCAKDEKYNHYTHTYTHISNTGAFTNVLESLLYCTNEALPGSHVRDILSPPPNC